MNLALISSIFERVAQQFEFNHRERHTNHDSGYWSIRHGRWCGTNGAARAQSGPARHVSFERRRRQGPGGSHRSHRRFRGFPKSSRRASGRRLRLPGLLSRPGTRCPRKQYDRRLHRFRRHPCRSKFRAGRQRLAEILPQLASPSGRKAQSLQTAAHHPAAQQFHAKHHRVLRAQH